MTSKSFAEHFHIYAEAPNGVQKLREMILQLAVKGKLVSQDPKDEPASVLLMNIKAEKESLIKEGWIKKQKSVSAVDPNTVPYELPIGWKWATLDEIGVINPRNDAPDDLEVAFSPMPLISAKYGEYPLFEIRRWQEIKKGFTHFGEGDVALAKITPCFQNGKSGVFRGLPNGIGAGTTELHIFRPIIGMTIPEYVWVYLKSPRFLQEGEFLMTGSAGQKRVPRNYFAYNPFPLPPVDEQKRIVARIDQLMEFCDELEALKTKRDKNRITLNNACLNALTSADKDTTEHAWQRIKDNFNLLYESPENVKTLRQVILQFAVQGRLVPQNPNDELASEQLKKVRSEKLQMIRNKIIKRDKLSLSCAELEGIDVPKGWAVAFMQDITSVITCGIASTPHYHDKGKIFLSAKNVKPYKFMPENHKYVDEKTYKKIVSWGAKPELNDILLTRVGAGIGEAALVDREIDFAYYVSLTLIKPIKKYISSRYLLHWLSSPEGIQKALENIYGRGVSQGNLNVNQVRKFIIPIPPQEEQKRIVAKVDQLMALCVELESKLKNSQSHADVLMDAAVHELTTI